jgi:hypothetical protein
MGVDDVSTVRMATVRLAWAMPYEGPPAPHLLRGAIAARFADNPLFHQHVGDQFVYRYPRVQYRWDRGCGVVVGFGDGVEALVELPWAGLQLRLGSQQVTVLDATVTLTQHDLVPAQRLLRYRFRAPWLPFNQDNYDSYQQRRPAEQAAERDRLAVAGILMALRGLDVEFPGRLYAAFHLDKARPCRYKDLQMLGFVGTLVANVELPDGFAIGRAVSHGYGWLVREHTTPAPTPPVA